MWRWGRVFKFLGGVGVHRLAPTQAGDDATTYYDDAGDDAGDDGDDVAARAEMGGVLTFFVRPALTVRSPHRPQPTTMRQMTRAMTPITTRRRGTMYAARVRDTDFSSGRRL